MMTEKLREWWTRANLWLDRQMYPGVDTTYEEWQEATDGARIFPTNHRVYVRDIHFKAAAWWAKFIMDDNGIVPTARSSPMGEALRGHGREEIHDGGYDLEKTVEFSDALAWRIAEKHQEGDRVYVAVDYSPGPILEDALEQVGIETSLGLFPKKAKMWVEDGEVYATVGRSAKRELIYPEGDLNA